MIQPLDVLLNRKLLLERVRRIYRDQGYKQAAVCRLLIQTIEEILDANPLRVQSSN